MNKKRTEPRHSISFFEKITFFKSQKSSDSESDGKLSDKQKYFTPFKSKKASMEKEWSKACLQMDKRAQILQVNIFCVHPISFKIIFF